MRRAAASLLRMYTSFCFSMAPGDQKKKGGWVCRAVKITAVSEANKVQQTIINSTVGHLNQNVQEGVYMYDV